jgi:hypothetical protein
MEAIPMMTFEAAVLVATERRQALLAEAEANRLARWLRRSERRRAGESPDDHASRHRG